MVSVAIPEQQNLQVPGIIYIAIPELQNLQVSAIASVPRMKNLQVPAIAAVESLALKSYKFPVYIYLFIFPQYASPPELTVSKLVLNGQSILTN
jgi:hypothetical protein